MKIQRTTGISFHSSENNKGSATKITNPYLYLCNPNAKARKEVKPSNISITLGGLAAVTVGITLWRLGRGHYIPESVVELADKNAGLNRIKGYDKNIKDLKSKVLFPIVATIKGDKSFFNNGLIKKGILISSQKDTTVAKEVYDAFFQHADKLGIKTIRMPMEDPKLYNINCEHRQCKWTKNQRIKWVNEAIKEAQEYYERTKNYVIIFFGDFGKLTNMKINKGQHISKIEERLASINKENYPGIVWAGWTDKQNLIPYFLNDMPSFISKLVPDAK